VARVGELDPRHAALIADELGNRLERGGVLVAPDSGVVGRDPSGGIDGRRFGHDDAGATHGPASEVDAVPLGREPVRLAGVLAHRRDSDSICRLYIAYRQRREQISHRSRVTTPARKRP